MPDDLPPISFDITDAGQPVVMVGAETVTDVAGLAAAAPGLQAPDYAVPYAQLVNHLAQGYELTLIVDPDAFKAEYEAQRAAEGESEPVPGRPRLSDHGVPDFAAISAPRYVDGKLVFYARHNYYGLPYRVELTSGGAPSYEPAPLN